MWFHSNCLGLFCQLNALKSRRFSLTGPPGGCSDSLFLVVPPVWVFFLPLIVLKSRRFSLTGPPGGCSDSSYCLWWCHLSGSSSSLKCFKKPSFQLDWPTWRMFGFFLLFVVVPPVWVFFSLPLELRNRHSSARYF